ncbi:efflux RND transporter periplasmic adaptor subunit [Pseudobutyrivibrio xylanivorans]|uniref:HlyD family efflux transporter periplasmic adaptor subunit n=1 Tax=Pseudobutyrivibrio xylanivorans TaxID=185007 RepID=A0A5P6VPE0_PSEXY|nr:efflux RND transporter periplasmic adaptor subunit [Pseudobutyrivibrio xylanivorans]QFJ54545.1 HlyD family efflux transporter periplasmic adaptor subunit [Pseudobutyrivibrio xylanivorans]
MSNDRSKEQKKPGKIKWFFKAIGRFIKGHTLLCFVLIALIAAGAFFGRGYLMKKKMADTQEAVGTLTTDVQVMDLQSSVSVTGTLQAGQSQSVSSTVATGTKVATVNYEVGDYVEAGAVVVEFDSDDYNTKLAQLNAKYKISDKKAAKSISDYEKQIEEYNEKITELQEKLDKYEIYYLDVKDAYDNYQKYPYSDEKQRYEEQSQVIQSLYGFTMKDYESWQDEIEDYKDKIEEAQYNIELAELQQEYDSSYTKAEEYDKITESQSGTQVVAPFSGYITAINVSEGNNYTQGNTVFTISNTDSFVVKATVDEYDIASIKEGLSAVVKFDATDDDEFTGTVTYVAVTSDSTTSSSSSGNSNNAGGTSNSSSSSASYEVKITLDGTDDRLRVGMTAKASVILESVENALAVPYDCVETDSDGNSYVTVVGDNDEETKVTVELGLESDYYVQIISSEISEGTKLKATASSGTSNDGQMPGGGSLLNLGGGGGAPGGGSSGGGAPGGGPGGF